ncbi:Dpc13p NDAI_0D02780 [Naumovozyma dairenensis CBS 421]|uniref:Uncharacterized protein n=1 Tax=Naumovozyma dairenensis (strain ATCC 10597 / BCRC 20456 / CBS 421 / NBRC 0211 / NRRL Y-12639) TaxID=1071378 RepID=G0W9Y1_NAUDC|nr:hypothetical protein NDAI_0D02780 [Naumovozyma dairenensis CBS 421]CCD24592.1 hypothetical protein NDAI_0D02780 [Naumovozyma dairenensis CBS 421]
MNVSKALRVSRILKPSIIHRQIPRRAYAKSWDKLQEQSNDKVDAHIKVNTLLNDITSKPNLAAKLETIQNIMIKRNLVSTEDTSKPKVWQMIKILTNKELRSAMEDFKKELAKSNVQLGPEQLKSLMVVLGMEKGSK